MEIETREDRILGRLVEIRNTINADMDQASFDTMYAEAMGLLAEVKPLQETRKAEQTDRAKIVKRQAERRAMLDGIASGTAAATTIAKYPGNRSERQMEIENKDIEIRAFHKYIVDGGTRNMNEVEQRALAIAGSAAVLPVDIYNQLVTSPLYSDLMRRCTIIRQGGAGAVQIPLAAPVASIFHVENAPGSEAANVLTSIVLNGYEATRLTQISDSVAYMTAPEFVDKMLEVLAAEVVQGVEASFITGAGAVEPTGLDNMAWGVTNQILTANAQTPISFEDIADGLGLMPAVHSRNAIIMMNAATYYDMATYSDANGNILLSVTGNNDKLFGKELCINEHVADNVIYIVNPRALYCRFAQDLTVAADRSAGFTTNSIWLKAQTIVDAKWNPAGAVRIGLGA